MLFLLAGCCSFLFYLENLLDSAPISPYLWGAFPDFPEFNMATFIFSVSAVIYTNYKTHVAFIYLHDCQAILCFSLAQYLAITVDH